ncbi:MAG: Sister chromatid cohesion protein 2 [Chrysothrix sp. TS-e1954]|nr:MAG: Sister chromatid cohesion protein 2 [Chrysothrix sp. TS-e1954]
MTQPNKRHNGLSQTRRTTLPTAEEALPFTPLTSFVPFDISIVPLPSPFNPSSRSSLASILDDGGTAHRQLQELDREVTNPDSSSTGAPQSLAALQSAFNGSDLTALKLKVPPPPDNHQQSQPETTKGPPPPPRPTPGLGPYAKMLLDTTNVQFRYPTPVSPGARASTVAHKTPHPVPVPPKAIAKPTSLSRLSPISNASAQLPQTSAGSITPTTSSRSSGFLGVVVPPTSSEHSEYRSYPELDASIERGEHTGSRKRKRGSDEPVPQLNLNVNLDLRKQADVAVTELKELLEDIFEAESKEEVENEREESLTGAQYFLLNKFTERHKLLLASEVLIRLDKLITKVLNAGRLESIALDSLLHLQQMCYSVLEASIMFDAAIPETLEEDTMDVWNAGLEGVKGALRASKILLRIMTAGREEKELYAETTVTALLICLRQPLEACIIPSVEARGNNQHKDFYTRYPLSRTHVDALLPLAGHVFELLGNVLLSTDLSEDSINVLISLTSEVIFVDNAGSEKDSLMGVQRFEGLRRNSMNALANIFWRYPGQRNEIFDEILSRLEKLSVKRQAAKNFKIADGKPVQLVSALILQLIQTVASGPIDSKSAQTLPGPDLTDGLSSTSSSPTKRASDRHQQAPPSPDDPQTHDSSDCCERLYQIAATRCSAAHRHASFVANFIIQRAMSTKKSDDQPYRELLDIFVQDFVGLLGNALWPSAELLLRALLTQLVGIATNDKSAVPAKNLALDLMGSMGSGITELRLSVQRTIRGLENSANLLDRRLIQVGEDVLNSKIEAPDLVSTTGPQATVLTSLEHKIADDVYLQSARDYYLVQWAQDVCNLRGSLLKFEENENEHEVMRSCNDTANWLLESIAVKTNAALDSTFDDITDTQSRLAFSVTTLNSLFCRNLHRIFTILLTSLSSSHATVRSRSLKSVEKLLENDPSLLDRVNNVMGHILKATTDSSTMVRDSALRLIAKCLGHRATLEDQVVNPMIVLSSDGAASVRKQSIKLLKDVFSHSSRSDTKSAIAAALLRRMNDVEETVRDLTTQTLEETWFGPFHQACTNDRMSVEEKQNLREHAKHIVTTLEYDETLLPALQTLVKDICKPSSKSNAANQAVCRAVVELLCDSVIDNQVSASVSRRAALSTLTVFVKADPGLLNAEQLMMLEPYIQNLATREDLVIYSSVVVIYRHTFPRLSSSHVNFMSSVQHKLLTTLQKLNKNELNEVTTCLQIIDTVLSNTERLVNLTISVIVSIKAEVHKDLSTDTPAICAEREKLGRRVTLAGYFGRNFRLEGHKEAFQKRLGLAAGASVSGLIVDIIHPLTSHERPPSLRERSLESIALICQSSPNLYEKPKVSGLFEEVFRKQETRLERVVLSGFKAFYAGEESRSKAQADEAAGEGAASGSARLGKSMTIGENDVAASTIAQHFLPHILKVALSSTDDLALLATEVIVSTDRQGLVHPKECEPALVALETSPNKDIARLAFEEHQAMHHKHESMLEKELITAIEQAFAYQRDVVQDPAGFTADFTCKLGKFFEVLKSGSLVGRKKFFANLCRRVDFNATKMDSVQTLQAHHLYVRFVCQSLGLAEYGRIDELLYLVACIEKIFTTTGNVLSQKIELALEGLGKDANGENAHDPVVSADVLAQLTLGSMMLMLLWNTRTHLRRLWSLQSFTGSKGKAALKDASKAPMRSAVASPEAFIKSTEAIGALSSPQAMVQQCRAFLETLSTDNEHRVSKSEDEDEDTVGGTKLETPDVDDELAAVASGRSRSGGSKKHRNSMMPTPGKPGRPRKTDRPSLGRRRSTKTSMGGGGDDSDGGWD